MFTRSPEEIDCAFTSAHSIALLDEIDICPPTLVTDGSDSHCIALLDVIEKGPLDVSDGSDSCVKRLLERENDPQEASLAMEKASSLVLELIETVLDTVTSPLKFSRRSS